MPFSSRRSSARKSGCAIEISASPRSRSDWPWRLTAPYSVTTQWTWPRVVTTPAPGFSCMTMRETLPPAAREGSAMIGLPPRERAAPRMKSIWPPMPENTSWPIESAHTWPLRSIWMAELMATIFGFLRITAVSFVQSHG